MAEPTTGVPISPEDGGCEIATPSPYHDNKGNNQLLHQSIGGLNQNLCCSSFLSWDYLTLLRSQLLHRGSSLLHHRGIGLLHLPTLLQSHTQRIPSTTQPGHRSTTRLRKYVCYPSWLHQGSQVISAPSYYTEAPTFYSAPSYTLATESANYWAAPINHYLRFSDLLHRSITLPRITTSVRHLKVIPQPTMWNLKSLFYVDVVKFRVIILCDFSTTPTI
jgi:hypothetical protein